MVVSRSFYIIILLFAAFEASLILGYLQSKAGGTVVPFHFRPLCLLAGLLADGLACLVVSVSASKVTVVEIGDQDSYGVAHERREYKVYGTPEIVTPIKDVVHLEGMGIKPFRRYLINHTDRAFLLYPIEYANGYAPPNYYWRPDQRLFIGPGECVWIRHRPDYWFKKPPTQNGGVPLDQILLPRRVVKWAIRECEPPVRDSSIVSRSETDVAKVTFTDK